MECRIDIDQADGLKSGTVALHESVGKPKGPFGEFVFNAFREVLYMNPELFTRLC